MNYKRKLILRHNSIGFIIRKWIRVGGIQDFQLNENELAQMYSNNQVAQQEAARMGTTVAQAKENDIKKKGNEDMGRKGKESLYFL